MADLHLVCFSGIGDHVLWLGLLPHVRRNHRVIVTCAPAMEGLAWLYPHAYDELRVEALPDAEIEALKRGPVDGRMLAWHGCWRGSELDWLARHSPGGTVADVVRDVLGCPGAEIVGPEWTNSAVGYCAGLPGSLSCHCRRQLDETGRSGDIGAACYWRSGGALWEGRTVLLAPFAHTAITRLPDQWWSDAAAHLTARGFTVVTNVANRGRGYDYSRAGPVLPQIPGTLAVDIPLSEIGPFAERCGFVLCARSGLSDLLARTSARMTVIWPRDETMAAYHDRHFAAWSVARVHGGAAREAWVDKGAGFDPVLLADWTHG